MAVVHILRQSPSAGARVVLLGFAAVIAQTVLLREAMAAMGGSELAWGAVMALWLLGMGAGARIGVLRGDRVPTAALPLLVLVLAGAGVVLFRAAPALLGATPGEAITTWRSLWLWAAAVLPPAVMGGMAFPLLAHRLGPRGPGRAYGLEAVGSLLGGVGLSILLAPLGAAAAVVLSLAVVATLELVHRRPVLAVAVAAAGALLAAPAADLFESAGWGWGEHPGHLAAWRETRQQRLELGAGPPSSLYADGRLVATFPDPYSTVPRAHLIMLLHPAPRRVIALGSLADGSVNTMARHPVRRLVAVEEDPELVRLLPGWYGPDLQRTLADPRVHAVAADPLRAVPSPVPWDMVVLLDGNPTTIRHNRSRTVEFFRTCRRSLRPNGVLVLRVEVSDTYLGGGGGALVAVLASTLRAVFPQVVAIPGEEILLVAGREKARLTLDPVELESRWRARAVADPRFSPDTLALVADPGRATALNEFVQSARASLNTTARPRAVPLAAALLEARSGRSLLGLSRWLEGRPPTALAVGLAAACLLLLILALLPRPPASATAAVIGLTSMGWWLLLIASWQASRGSVYAEVGALTAVFMAGLGGGALAATRWDRPARRVPLLLGAGIVVSALIASQTPVLHPLLLVPVLLAAGGFLTGAAFPGVADLVGRGRSRQAAGIAFAADEAGAAGAALLVGIVALPWAGMVATAGGLGLLCLAAIPAVLVSLRRGAPRRP